MSSVYKPLKKQLELHANTFSNSFAMQESFANFVHNNFFLPIVNIAHKMYTSKQPC